jgi:hypothetical protein
MKIDIRKDISGAVDPTMSSQPPPAKRDKFAALAAAQQQLPPSQAPKRDKFASLQAKQGAESLGGSHSPARTAVSLSGSASQIPPKRDEFASLNSGRQSEEAGGAGTKNTAVAVRRGDKFAAVRQQKQVAEQQTKQQALLDKCRQRDQVWKDLDTAEAAVVRLLQLAEQTASILAAQTTTPSNESSSNNTMSNLVQIQSQYQEKVHEIHSLLKPHTEFVRAYEAPARVNPMYLQRVELRLADSKVRLLEQLNENLSEQTTELSSLSQPEPANNIPLPGVDQPISDGGKRKRED